MTKETGNLMHQNNLPIAIHILAVEEFYHLLYQYFHSINY